MNEIRGALEQIRDRLNEFLSASGPRPDGWVVLSNLYDPDGKPCEAARDKLVMMLVNIQRESSVSTYNQAVQATPDAYVTLAPPLYIDLFVLLYANFSDARYPEGLAVISAAIRFFQRNPVFTPKTLPELDPAIDKLVFDLTNLDVTEVNHLVGMLGANYLPLLYFKVRMIPYQSAAMQAEVPAVHQLQNPGGVQDAVPEER